jgi:hypothetical protein
MSLADEPCGFCVCCVLMILRVNDLFTAKEPARVCGRAFSFLMAASTKLILSVSTKRLCDKVSTGRSCTGLADLVQNIFHKRDVKISLSKTIHVTLACCNFVVIL